ncbi:hypothetical protein ACETK8_07620 [Brevundimonas staleyi]|uniref:Uncharacterized protein n=1 Tax=Brevundimonas staleyi TaxID=74326 RepID=A0ABW0FPJ1_9CAUL
MRNWTVELDVSFLAICDQWPSDQKLELQALTRLLQRLGPEGLGFIRSEWEMPDWDDLASPVSLPLPVHLSTGWKTLALDILPARRVVVVSLV